LMDEPRLKFYGAYQKSLAFTSTQTGTVSGRGLGQAVCTLCSSNS
jgi:hypothetical protein